MPRLLLVAAAIGLALPAAAQADVSLGADLVTRYVWRGFDFGQSFSAQPSLAVASGPVEVGAWGSYALASSDANELDLYVTVSAGPVTVGVTDYYFPTAPPDLGVTSGADYFNLSDGGDGAHYLEPFVSLDAAPVTFTVATVAYNDPAFSTYAEAAYAFEVSGTSLQASVGGVFALDAPDDAPGSAFYGTSRDAALTALSITAARAVPITDAFSLPVFGQYVVNPETERAFLLFGVSL